MRIVYAGTLPPHPGGSALHGFQLLGGLAARGHEVSAIAPITAQALGRIHPLAGAPFALTRYLVPEFEMSPHHPASAEFRALEGERVTALLAPLLDAAPDVVIAGRETFAWHVPGLARRRGVASVVISHGGAVWGMLEGTYPPELTRALVERMNEADRVIAVARHFATRMRELGLERIATIPNAVDTRAFAPAPPDGALRDELELVPENVVVMHTSNLKDVKRPLDLARSAALAIESDSRLVYVVVGDGPCRAALEAECRNVGVLERFRFTGWVPSAEMPRYLSVADAVVMPSETEALALAYLEAQACGRLLIATDIPGAREVVEHGVTGLLYPVGDVRALADTTLRAAADPGLRAAIGARARSRALSRPLEDHLAAFEALFAEIAHSRKGAPQRAGDDP